MKQLLIVKSGTTLNGGASNPKDLNGMAEGSIGIYHLNDPSSFIASNAHPSADFAIAYGRGANSPVVMIPEVDFGTLHVTIAEPQAGAKGSYSVTVPTTVDGNTYTIVLVKKGAAPHERNTWTATETVYDSTKQTASVIGGKLRAYFQAMADSGSLNVVVGGSGATITITDANYNEPYIVKLSDDFAGETITTSTAYAERKGDKADIEKLASMCAQNRGFSDTHAYGDSIYPGYPMAVENTTYRVITLRFATGRKSAKTRDERVSQLVHIAVPYSATATDMYTVLKSIFTISGKTRYNAD